MHIFIEFPKVLLKLLANKAYLCMLVTAVTSVYVIIGVFVNIPRYLEIHFFQPAFKANIGAGITSTVQIYILPLVIYTAMYSYIVYVTVIFVNWNLYCCCQKK